MKNPQHFSLHCLQHCSFPPAAAAARAELTPRTRHPALQILRQMFSTVWQTTHTTAESSIS